MKISGLKVLAVPLRLAEPYTIAYEIIHAVTNVFVRLETDDGICGCGCAAPDLQVTGETAEGVVQILNEVTAPVLTGLDPLRPALVLDSVRDGLRSRPAAKAALDMALFDILGKKANLPLWQLLGGYRDKMPTSVTIGILPEKETLERARDFVARKFKILKLKGGLDVEDDIARLKKVREAVGADIQLLFDANQGFSVEESRQFIEQTKSIHLKFVEQPTPKESPQLLGEVAGRAAFPVMADESLLTLEDALHIACGNLAAMLNIKLMKVGGIREASRIDAVAAAAGQRVMVGCMDEAALAIAAGLHFALSSSNVAYADLDGHLDLVDDPTSGAVVLQDGFLIPNRHPGLGFEITF